MSLHFMLQIERIIIIIIIIIVVVVVNSQSISVG